MSEINLFLDSTALFTGIASEKGAARALLLLTETGHVPITISEQVVTETERTIARKVPQASNELRQAILTSKAQIVKDPSPEDVKTNHHRISDPTDVPIVLAAMKATVDYLVTLNRKHFIDDPDVAVRTGLQIRTPGDVLNWIHGTFFAEVQ